MSSEAALPRLSGPLSGGPRPIDPLESSALAGRNRARWSAGLVLSLFAHVAMFGGALLYARLVPPHTVAAPPIVAHLVRLGKPRPDDALPRLEAPTRASSSRKSHPDTPEPKPSPTAVPAPAPPKPVDADESDDDAPNPSHEKEAMQRQKRLEDALAKLGAPTDGPTSPKGDAPAGQADGDTQGNSDKAAEGDAYAAKVQAALKRNFVVPTTISDKERLRLRADVRIFISADGKITSHKIEKGSDNDLYDRAVEGSIEATDRLPPPPADLRTTYSLEGLGVEFTP